MSDSIQQDIQRALEHHRAGRLAQAEIIYRDVLKRDPENADALHLMGVLSHQVGQHSFAEQFIRVAIDVNPLAPDYHNNLGEALRAAGKIDEAVESFLHAVALNPDYAEAYANLGAARRQQKRFEEAESAWKRSIELQPRQVQSYSQLAEMYAGQRRFDRAAELLAIAVQNDPTDASLHIRLSIALKELHRFELAAAQARAATKLQPDSAEAHANLGVILQAAGRVEDAIAAFQQAIALNPEYADAYNNLGFCFSTLNKLADAEAALREAVRLAPASAQTLANLGNVLTKQARTEEAIDTFRKAIELRPDLRIAHANLLLALNYDDRTSPSDALQEASQWTARHTANIAPPAASRTQTRDPHRRLRIAYVSPDFRQHSVAHFIEPLLKLHNRNQVEVICFSDVPRGDAVTQRLRAFADTWHDVRGLSDEQLAARIRADAIDILIDLAGHTAGNRLLTFARKPAPVQVSYLGYPNTTALAAIDYRITDALADPIGVTDSHFTEKLIRLPRCGWCYRPPPEAPPPQSASQQLTFGSFNKSQKISPSAIQAWARLMERIPDSRLIIKSPILDDDSARRYLLESLDGIDGVELVGRSATMAEHLAHYNEIDIALDTFPYNGTTTTCDALWMGVPVITLAGDRHISRVGVSLLNAAGLPQLVAADVDDYVNKAADLASDRARLAELRQTLRQQMQQSPLCDGASLAAAIEDAYRLMWRTWCDA